MHAQCDCLKPVVQRHGRRRRRCVVCGRTWSIRPRPRGRKPKKPSPTLTQRVFVDGESIGRLARDCHRSVETVRRRCREGCRALVARRPLPELPVVDCPLALVADGLWSRFSGRIWVAYDMAVKPAGIPAAFFLDPVMIEGRECARTWLHALTTIPLPVGERIRALVADGFRGCRMIARQRGWILQRCHRHLDAKLLGPPGRRRNVCGAAVREAALDAIREARSTADPKRAAELCRELAGYVGYSELSRRIAGVIRRFLHDIVLYRAYLDYPELELPTTTNAVESRHSRLRSIVSGVNNPQAAILRIRAYTRLHPSITCNGHKNPQI